jgi:hypothetical protein
MELIVGSRQAVFDIERLMRQAPQVELKVKHYFSKGVYARELHIPAGVILTGEIHKFENLNILSQGKIEVLTEKGMQEVEAPFTIVSPAGTKRIARAITDCIWTTIHGTDENDLNIIEKTFIAKSEQEWLEFRNANQLEFKL